MPSMVLTFPSGNTLSASAKSASATSVLKLISPEGDVNLKGRNQLRQGFTGFFDDVHDRDHGVERAVGKEEIFEVKVTGQFTTEGTVHFAQLGFHEGMAHPTENGRAAVGDNLFGHNLGTADVVDNGAGSPFLEEINGNERGQDIRGNDLAFVIHKKAAVGIAVKSNPEIQTLLANLGLKRFQGGEIEGVGQVVGEGKVQIPIERHCVLFGFLEEIFNEEATHAVAAINGELELAG